MKIKLLTIFLLTTILVCFVSYVPTHAQDSTWKWIACGDTRNCPPRSQHAQVLQSMVANTPDYKFIINVGDVVDHGYDASEWDAWFEETSEILGGLGQDQVPPKYMATPGNHDATETKLGLTNWNTYLSGQVQQYGNEGKFFVFDYENARFIVMDSDKSSETGAQYTMLLDAIKNNPKTWLFTVWHHPIFDFGEKYYADGIHDTWGITLYEHGCDMIFNGHAHYYVRTKKLKLNGDPHPPLDPENGTVQVVTGNGGAPIDIPDPNHEGNGYFVEGYSTYAQYGYTELTVGTDSLWLKHYLRNGTILDEEVYTPNEKAGSSFIIKKDPEPTNFQLYQNYPNPFNPSTSIKFDVVDYGHVILKIYNIMGQEVATLIDRQVKPGLHRITWNHGNLAAGVYFYKMEVNGFVEIKKMLLAK